MRKFRYYVGKLKEKIRCVLDKDRIRKYGLSLAMWDLLVFLMHRNDSWLEHFFRRKRDDVIQSWLYRNYGSVIQDYRDEGCQKR